MLPAHGGSLLTPASRPAAPLVSPAGSSFCLGLSIFAVLFLSVLASLIHNNYPYAGDHSSSLKHPDGPLPLLQLTIRLACDCDVVVLPQQLPVVVTTPELVPAGEWFEPKAEPGHELEPLAEQREEVVESIWKAVAIYAAFGVVSGVAVCFHKVRGNL
jgi:hypothetical protein